MQRVVINFIYIYSNDTHLIPVSYTHLIYIRTTFTVWSNFGSIILNTKTSIFTLTRARARVCVCVCVCKSLYNPYKLYMHKASYVQLTRNMSVIYFKMTYYFVTCEKLKVKKKDNNRTTEISSFQFIQKYLFCWSPIPLW